MTYYIYCITNKINNKSYVGQSSNVQDRWYKHIKDAYRTKNTNKKYSRKFAFQNAIAKYGEDNFVWQIIDETNTMDEANELEEFYIAYLNTQTPNGYNILPGGKNRTLPESSKKKISETLKKVGTITSNSGPKHPRWGVSPTQAERDNLSKKFGGKNGTGVKLTEEQALNIYQLGLIGLSANEVKDELQLNITSKNTILNIFKKKSWKELLKDLPPIKMRKSKYD